MRNYSITVDTDTNDLFRDDNEESHLAKQCLQDNIREIKLQPYQQGIDQLCGIYSLINATRLVIRPMRIKAELLSRCFTTLVQKKRSHDFITNGTYVTYVSYMLKEIFIKEYPIKTSKPFRQKVPLEIYWDKLTEFLEKENRAVVMLFYTASAGHWTVIREITETQLILFDSKKTRNLKKEICTTTELSESKTRIIIPTMSFLIQKS